MKLKCPCWHWQEQELGRVDGARRGRLVMKRLVRAAALAIITELRELAGVERCILIKDKKLGRRDSSVGQPHMFPCSAMPLSEEFDCAPPVGGNMHTTSFLFVFST